MGDVQVHLHLHSLFHKSLCSLQELLHGWNRAVWRHAEVEATEQIDAYARVQALRQVDRLQTQPGSGFQVTLLTRPDPGLGQVRQVELPSRTNNSLNSASPPSSKAIASSVWSRSR